MLGSFLFDTLDLRTSDEQGVPLVIWDPGAKKGVKRKHASGPWAGLLADRSDSSGGNSTDDIASEGHGDNSDSCHSPELALDEP